ncbi:pyrroline-5-carboxylate reductase [Aphanothece hegewaldii CCALA 016]|uniref:Pyrroline-5-carboxylate reductase n=1 Tax=Aphanothece hegewaldii CCALA 016 TaxID=2107694 RepID=A0A2T1LZZ6_9CHRO|nr:pyrroline-5-carboxylate reductase [Aphanothece hegewaldii]PSF37957.1 pyrroline-5-carboxylate reductase [Aphanothece hegewaldii CCALA 016]
MSIKLGIIGGGVMAEAILSRLLAQQIYDPNTVLISEPQQQRQEFLQAKYQVNVTSDNRSVTQSEVILLAIKPQVLSTVSGDLSELSSTTLMISILAGVPLKRLEEIFLNNPIIRVMPNTPATVGAAMTAIASGKHVQSHHLSLTKNIFCAIGEVVEVSESLMDAVTGLSGSGPAFVAMMIEALADGGVAAGLPRAIALPLALQTVLGTAQLIQTTGIHPAQLKDQVTSPGGTTIAGVAQLEKQGFRSAVIEAVYAAYKRSVELGQKS